MKAEVILGDSNENYIMSLSEIGAEMISSIPSDFVSDEEYANVMESIDMKGIDSAYAYMVSEDGTMIYHPTKEKIGEAVENSVIKGVVEQLKAGKKVENALVEYDYDGAVKYAGYALTSNNDIVVVTADKDEIIEPLNGMVKYMISISLFTLVISLAATYILSIFITKPIQKMTQIIMKLQILILRQLIMLINCASVVMKQVLWQERLCRCVTICVIWSQALTR